MDIFLSINNGEETLTIPVLPPTFDVKKPQGSETFETFTGAELRFISAPKLKSIGWTCFFPSKEYPFNRDFKSSPHEYVYTIDRWILSKVPIRLVVSGTPINMACAVNDFSYSMSTNGDVNYTIEFGEFPLVDTENEVMTVAQYEEIIGEINGIKARLDNIEARFNTIDEVPDWGKETVQKLIDAGVIQGGYDGGLGLTWDMLRVLVILDRMQIFDV